MKVLILGFGYTGQRLGRWLSRQGHDVIGTNRSGAATAELPIPILKFDSQESTAEHERIWQSVKDVTHVVSTIAPTREGTDPAWALLTHCPYLKRLSWAGYLSTTGVYGDTGGAWVDELSPVQPGNARSQARVTIEQQWLGASIPTHIFRLPGIYGPRRSIFEKIRAGKVQQIVKPGHVFSRIHVDDIVQTIASSMIRPTPDEIYNVVDDEPSEPRDLLLEATALLKVLPPPPIPFEKAQFSPMGRSFWAECRRVSNQKIKDKLGIQLLYPSYREGLRAIFAEL